MELVSLTVFLSGLLREDMREKGLCIEDSWDRSRWSKMLWEGHR